MNMKTRLFKNSMQHICTNLLWLQHQKCIRGTDRLAIKLTIELP